MLKSLRAKSFLSTPFAVGTESEFVPVLDLLKRCHGKNSYGALCLPLGEDLLLRLSVHPSATESGGWLLRSPVRRVFRSNDTGGTSGERWMTPDAGCCYKRSERSVKVI